jgi:hypothetical protein
VLPWAPPPDGLGRWARHCEIAVGHLNAIAASLATGQPLLPHDAVWSVVLAQFDDNAQAVVSLPALGMNSFVSSVKHFGLDGSWPRSVSAGDQS